MMMLALASLLPLGLNAHIIDLGVFYGQRAVNDKGIRDTFGNGMVYYPFLAVNFKGFMIGAGYEAGYKKSAKVGMYQESATLEVKGLEIFVGYQMKFLIFAPFVKVGYGSFSYKQTVESPYLGQFKVDHKKSSFTAAGGLKAYILSNIFIGGEIKFVPLKVKPIDVEVDLGGLRILGGIGFSL